MSFQIHHIKPLFTGVIVTAMRYKSDQTTTPGGLLLDTTRKKGDLNIYQTVYAVGDMVHGVKEGDIVCINLKRYLVPKHLPGEIENNIQHDNMVGTYEIPMVTIDGIDYLYLQNNDIDYVIDKFTVDDGGLLE